jgi:hypothetical protein
MPFKSKRQWRAAFSGRIPGFSKTKAREWAHETSGFQDLPDRSPAEKGEPTLRSKKSQLAHAHDSGKGLSEASIQKGQKVEFEHTNNPVVARQIAIDHLRERKDYYERLAEIEKSAFSGRLMSRLAYLARHTRRAKQLEQLLPPDAIDRVLPDAMQEYAKEKSSAYEALVSLCTKLAFALPKPGQIMSNAKHVGSFPGTATANFLKPPGRAASTQAILPGRNIRSAMNAFKA